MDYTVHSIHRQLRLLSSLQWLKGGSLKRIHEGNLVYAPLHYVLLFPRGELGWHKDILLRGLPEPLNCWHNGDSSDEDGKMLTIAKYHVINVLHVTVKLKPSSNLGSSSNNILWMPGL